MDRKKIYPEMGVSEREQALKNVATTFEHLAKYKRELDDETLAKIREDKCNADVAIERLKDQQKVANDGYKSKIKDLQNKAGAWLKEIETGKRDEEGLLSGIIDQSEGRVYFYDRYGDLIKSRPILPEEKITQGSLFANDPAQQAVEKAVFGENVEIPVQDGAALVGQPVAEEEITDLEFEEAPELDPGMALEGVAEFDGITDAEFEETEEERKARWEAMSEEEKEAYKLAVIQAAHIHEAAINAGLVKEERQISEGAEEPGPDTDPTITLGDSEIPFNIEGGEDFDLEQE